MKKGDVVLIYHDSMTKKKEEGLARLFRCINPQNGADFWEVRFLYTKDIVRRFIPVDIPTLNEIKSVIFNQKVVSQKLLDLYEGWPSQFTLLVRIITEAQRINPDNEIFQLFVAERKVSWNKWAMAAKAFRKWLATTHYTYESVTLEGLSELFLEELILRAAPK